MGRAFIVVVFALALSQMSWAQEGVSVKEKKVTFITTEGLMLRPLCQYG